MPHKNLALIASRFRSPEAAGFAELRRIVDKADRTIVLVRDMDLPRSILNPFTFEERVEMIRTVFPGPMENGEMSVFGLGSSGYDASLALATFDQAVLGIMEHETDTQAMSFFGLGEAEAALMKARFPTCSAVPETETSERTAVEAFIRGDDSAAEPVLLPWLAAFRETEALDGLKAELSNADEVRRLYGKGPHMTADAICTYGDEILLITRGNHPFKGALAIPGGIIDKGEDPLDAAVRELAEETCISTADGPLPENVLHAALRAPVPLVYDGMERDPRGNYRAHAFHFDFSTLPEKPHVRPSSDARLAEWTRLEDIVPGRVAFDHFAILHDVIGLPYPDAADLPARGIAVNGRSAG